MGRRTGASGGPNSQSVTQTQNCGGQGSVASVRIDLRDHRRERKRAQGHLVVFRALVFAFSAALVALVVWLFFFSSVFALRAENINVEGAQSDLAMTEVIPSVSAYEGVPLPRVPAAGIAADLASRPLIAEAEVSRSWPHGLDIRITQRQAVAMVPTDGGYSLVGPDGVITGTSTEPVPDLPLVEVSAEDPDQIQLQAAEAILVLDSLPESVRAQVETTQVSSRVVSLTLTSGAQVVWGDEAESDLKAQVLSLLVEQRPSEVYDLRDPRQPVTR